MLIMFFIIFLMGSVAQSVEQKTENLCVGGSIPSRATKTIWGSILSIFYWTLRKSRIFTIKLFRGRFKNAEFI